MDTPEESKDGQRTSGNVIQVPVEHLELTTHAPTIKITPYSQALLDLARDLINRDQFNIAVVVAHMACEIAAECSLSEASAAKGLQHLQESVTQFMNGYNLANEKQRKFSTALTGGAIENQPFWSKFRASEDRRNAVMHRGLFVSRGSRRITQGSE